MSHQELNKRKRWKRQFMITLDLPESEIHKLLTRLTAAINSSGLSDSLSNVISSVIFSFQMCNFRNGLYNERMTIRFELSWRKRYGSLITSQWILELRISSFWCYYFLLYLWSLENSFNWVPISTHQKTFSKAFFGMTQLPFPSWLT